MGRHSRKKGADPSASSAPSARDADAGSHGGGPVPRQASTGGTPEGPEASEVPEAPRAAGPSGYEPGTAVPGRRNPRAPGRAQGPAPGPGPGPGPGAGTVPGSGPGARGGHPQQREPGGGWGADGMGQGPAPGGGGAGGDTGVGRVLLGGGTGAGPAAGGGPGAATPPGPRQEYLDAFDDDVFAPGAPAAPAAPGAPGADRTSAVRPPRTDAPDTAVGAGGMDGGHGAATGHGADGARGRPDEGASVAQRAVRAKRSGGMGRAVTGTAAAAVTTVLAIVIAGQVADGSQHPADRASDSKGTGRTKDDSASRSDGRKAPKAPDTATTYDAKMGRLFPLSAGFKGKGDFHTVSGRQKGPGHGRVLRYRVDVEKGLPLEGDLFAKAVHKTLNDKRSWGHGGKRSFERVDHGHTDFVITLASPRTTDEWCAKSGLDTSEEHVSCDSASTDRIMINGYRWARGAKTFEREHIHQYRQMLINHEVGHRLGHNHVGCPKKGELAPVMMQQTKYLTTDGVRCRPNAWPFPRG